MFRQVYGDSFELPMFVAPLRELVLGDPAPRDDVTSFLERVRVLCTVYDPRAGRYRLNYALLVELFTGTSIVIATLWYVIAASRRRRSGTGRPNARRVIQVKPPASPAGQDAIHEQSMI